MIFYAENEPSLGLALQLRTDKSADTFLSFRIIQAQPLGKQAIYHGRLAMIVVG